MKFVLIAVSALLLGACRTGAMTHEEYSQKVEYCKIRGLEVRERLYSYRGGSDTRMVDEVYCVDAKGNSFRAQWNEKQ